MKKPRPVAAEAEKLLQKARSRPMLDNRRKAFQLLLRAAKLGNEEAQVLVGYDFAYGGISEIDIEEALHWWKTAWAQGSWDAAFNLGKLYSDQRQWKKAIKWFERAVRAGDPDGLVEIARIHFRYGGDRDAGLSLLKQALAAKENLTSAARNQAERLFEQENARTSLELLYAKADWLDQTGRYAKAFELFLEGARQGDSKAQVRVADYLSSGRKSVPRNSAQAIVWYQQAHQQNNPLAAINLGRHYQRHGKVDQAIDWMQRSAQSGDDEANLSLAKLYLYDLEDVPNAIQHLEAIFQKPSPNSSPGALEEARSMLRRLQNAPLH